MDWWKLFSGTFILIFLAELGDKTQLAAMAKTADSPGDSTAKWVVFLAASLALVASTFIAVFLGHILKSLVPDERYIKIAAGTLFLVFGFMILFETYRSFRTESAPAPLATANAAENPGLVGALALRAAMDFESLAADRYRRLAASAPPRLAKLLDALAGEEEGHLASLRDIPATEQQNDGAYAPTPELQGELEKEEADTLFDLIHHEEATAEFYQSLADRSLLPPLRNVFAKLAEDERTHAARLRSALTSQSGRI